MFKETEILAEIRKERYPTQTMLCKKFNVNPAIMHGYLQSLIERKILTTEEVGRNKILKVVK